MSEKKKKSGAGRRLGTALRVAAYFSLGLMLALCLALLGGYWFAGDILERIVFPTLVSGAGVKKFSAKVNHADYDGLDISALSMGDGVSIKHLNVSLEHGSLKSLLVDGLRVSMRWKDGKLVIPGVYGEGPKRPVTAPFFLAKGFSVRILDSSLSLAALGGNKSPGSMIPFHFEAMGTGNSVEFKFKMRPMRLAMDGAAFSMDGAHLVGEMSRTDSGFGARCSAQLSNGAFHTGKLRFSGLKLDVPARLALDNDQRLALATLPNDADCPQGTIEVGKVSWGKRFLLATKMTTRQAPSGSLDFNGVIRTRAPWLTPGVHAEIASIGKGLLAGDILLNLDASFYTKDETVDLGDIAAALKGLKFNGSGKLHLESERRAGTLKYNLAIMAKATEIADSKTGANVSGVVLDMKAGGADLAGFSGYPKGKLRFGTIKIQNTRIDSGEVDFQIEPGAVLFVERAKFAFCGGYVESDAFRASQNSLKQFDVTLYCSKLRLADVLNALGIGKASGIGAVSGRIPLKIHNRRITVENGFLDSAPGEGGNIKLTDFAGPMAVVASQAQLELVSEALKDFNYDWLRISLKSDNSADTMLVKLMMSGAPADKLPFEFDAGGGGFRKTSDPDKTAHFQKMTLEITFIMPGKLLKTH